MPGIDRKCTIEPINNVLFQVRSGPGPDLILEDSLGKGGAKKSISRGARATGWDFVRELKLGKFDEFAAKSYKG